MGLILIRNVHLRAASRGLTVSVGINLAMIVAGLVSGFGDRNSLLARFSNLIAAPPGLLIIRCCQPRQHTVQSFVASVAASIAISTAFYAIAAWVLLELLAWLKSRTGHPSPNL